MLYVTSCTKASNLEITAVDGVGAKLKQTEIYLFKDSTSYANGKVGYYQRRTTDSEGKVIFSSVSPGHYYVSAFFKNLFNEEIKVYGEVDVEKDKNAKLTIKP